MNPSLDLSSKNVYRACKVIWSVALEKNEHERWLQAAVSFHTFSLAAGGEDAAAFFDWLYQSAMAMASHRDLCKEKAA